MDGENRRVTFKTLFGIATAILSFMATVLWFVMTDRIKTAEAKIELKVDKADFIRAFDKFDVKLEKIDAAIREHESNAARRRGD